MVDLSANRRNSGRLHRITVNPVLDLALAPSIGNLVAFEDEGDRFESKLGAVKDGKTEVFAAVFRVVTPPLELLGLFSRSKFLNVSKVDAAQGLVTAVASRPHQLPRFQVDLRFNRR